jgi:hypothetical protein
MRFIPLLLHSSRAALLEGHRAEVEGAKQASSSITI